MAVLGAISLVAGCGTDSAGKATPSTSTDTSTATAALWDPCTAIPDSVLLKVGVDPASKESGAAGVEEPGWKICSWDNSDFNLAVFSTALDVDEFTGKSGNVDFADIRVGERSGVRFHRSSDKGGYICDLVFPVEQGAVSVMVSNRVSSKNKVDPCVRADAAAATLLPVFPG